MAGTLECDLCVIGAGSGGLTVAAGAAQMGARVVLVEAGRMGGDCLNHGCVPSKALIAAAAHARAVRAGAAFGVGAGAPVIDWHGVRRHVQAAIDAIAPHDSQERFEGLGVTVLRSRARFVDPATVEADGTRIRARRFVVATGSRPAIPPVPGLDGVPYLTNETLFDLPEQPEHLLVLGAGPIGCEMAQAFARLGSRVTLVDIGPMLPKEDPDLVAPVRTALRGDGVDVRERVEVRAVEAGPTLVLGGRGAEERIRGSHLLVATGRRPNVEDLALEEAGIACDRNGIRVDSGLRTTNRRVYAVGDVTGGPQFTHAAAFQAGIVLRRALLRLPAKAGTAAMPRVTYTDPELAWVGLARADVEADGRLAEVLDFPFARIDRAHCEGRTDGLLRLLLGRRRKVLGVGIVGAHAGELLLPWCLALGRGLPLSALASTIAPYPTMSEISKRAAGAAFESVVYGPWMRRLVRFLSRFG